jgi:hypothetical protein
MDGSDRIQQRGMRLLILGGWWRSAAAMPQLAVVRAAAWRSKLLLALRSTKHDKVFTYGIGVTHGARFPHLGTAAGNGGGWRWRGGSAQAWCRGRQALVLLR